MHYTTGIYNVEEYLDDNWGDETRVTETKVNKTLEQINEEDPSE